MSIWSDYSPEAPNSLGRDPAGVGAPGLFEGFIPIWGSGRASIDDFQNGRWGWGTFNGIMAASDILLVKSLATIGIKGAWKLGSTTWGATRKWLAKKGYAEFGQHVHHGLVPREAFNGTWWERVFNQPWNLKPLEPRPGFSMDKWHKMVEGKVPGLYSPERWWYGTPDWFRYAEISTSGDLINVVGDINYNDPARNSRETDVTSE